MAELHIITINGIKTEVNVPNSLLEEDHFLDKSKVKDAIENTIKKEDAAINSPDGGCNFIWQEELLKELRLD